MKRRELLAAGGALVSAVSGCLDEFGETPPDISAPDHDGWPMAGYDAGNTGHHRTASLPSSEPEQYWTKQIDDIDSVAMLLVSDRQVYIGSRTLRNPPDYLYQLATDSGDVVRTTRLGHRSSTPTSAIADGTIYIKTRQSRETSGIEALDTTDGSQQWQFEVDDELAAPLVVAGDRLYFTTESQLVALDREEGTEHWRQDVSQRVQPAIGNGAVHISSEGTIHAYDRQHGDLQWEYELSGSGSLAPVVRHGRVYAGDGTDVIALEEGEEVWRNTARDDLEGNDLLVEADVTPDELPIFGQTLAVDDSQVYLSRTPFLQALDAETGAGQWTTPLPKMEAANNLLRQPLSVADSTLLVPLARQIGAVDTADGSIQWTVDGPFDPTGRIAVSDGRLFTAGTDGDVYVYGHPSET